jgi:hypothetical protein
LNDPVYQNDTIVTGKRARASLLFKDNTQFTLSEKTKLKISDWVYDPNAPPRNKASYSILQGAFQYVSGLLEKQRDRDVNIDTPYGCICIRGTELISKVDTTAKTVEFDPTAGPAGSTITAPAQIKVGGSGIQVLPMTQDQYNEIKAQYFPTEPTS